MFVPIFISPEGDIPIDPPSGSFMIVALVLTLIFTPVIGGLMSAIMGHQFGWGAIVAALPLGIFVGGTCAALGSG